MHLKQILQIITCMLFFNCAHAQIPIGRHLKQINAMESNQDKIQGYIDIAWEYHLIESDSSLLYAEKAYQLAIETDDKFGQVFSLESKGIYYDSVKNDYETAVKLYLEAIELSDNHDLNYSNSLYMSLGIIFQVNDDYETAARYFEESVTISRKIKDYKTLKYGLANYGVALNRLNKIDDAEKVLLECINTDVVDIDTDLTSFSNLGNIYDRKGLLEKASIYHKKSLEFPNDYPILINYLPNYAATLRNNIARKDSTGIDTLVTRLYSFANSGSSIQYKATAYEAISEAHFFKEEYKDAAITSKKAKDLSDSIYTLNLKQTTFELERKYESSKTRTQLKQEKNNRNIYIAGVITLFLFLMLLGYFFYKRNKTNKVLSSQKILLEKTIDQKNILLKETHHRVKNSFQMVSSLLYIQGETTNQKDAQTAIKEAQNRVRSMVLTHQKLYNTEDLVGIDTREYITDLTKDVVDSYNLQNNIKHEVNAETHILNIDTITPLGIILNELLTNCFKHAFTDNIIDPTINIKFKKQNEQYILQVIDNGVGISNNRRNGALGLELLEGLAIKLNGVFDIQAHKENGTNAIVKFELYQLN